MVVAHRVNRNPGVLKISLPFLCFLFLRDMVIVVIPTEKIVIPAAMKHVHRPGLEHTYTLARQLLPHRPYTKSRAKEEKEKE
jgi:hypothetical protein